MLEIDVNGTLYKDLNKKLREAVFDGSDKILLKNVCGQRYIGTDLNREVEIEIQGTPGNDLGAFMDGPKIKVHGNAQDGCGNTMDQGEIVIYGHAGDVLGLSARGGKIFVKEGVGYRAGIHMKEYQEKKPVIVIGGGAQDFLGEYMGGGILILLGMNSENGSQYKAKYIGTGMHGGTMYLRGTVDDYQIGREVGIAELDDSDYEILDKYLGEFAVHFGYDKDELLSQKFTKLFPRWLRPYGKLYTY